MERINLLDPHVRANPYPCYAELRRTAPVTQVDPGGIWAVSRYDDVLAVLKNPAVFSSQGLRAMFRPAWLDKNPVVDSFGMMDPPEHTRLRALATRTFTTRVLPRVELLARDVARTFAERAGSAGEMDFCEELSLTLPASVIAGLLGIDGNLAGHARQLRSWSNAVVAATPITPVEEQLLIKSSITELCRFLDGVLDDRRREPRDDLPSNLLDAQVDGQGLRHDEIQAFLALLLVAGFETVGHVLANSMHILAAHSKLLPRLCAEPASIPQFVEEVLRFESSVHATARVAVEDADVGGIRVPAGSAVLALVASANRDESRFEDAECFNMDRRFRAHLSFGSGIHACLGAALARTQVRIALEEIVQRIRAVHLLREPVWNQSMTARGPLSSLLRFEPI